MLPPARDSQLMQTMKKVFSSLGLAVGLLPASAGVVLFNTSITPDDQIIAGATSSAAISFTTGPEAMQIDNVGLRMGIPVSTTANFRFGLFGNSGSLPGSPIYSFGGPSTPDGGALGAIFNFTPNVVQTLSPNTTYWLVMSSNGSGGQYTVLSVGTGPFTTNGSGWSGGTDTWFSTNFGSTWTSSSHETPIFQINATAVPEPAETAAMGAVALAGFACVRRRWSRPTGQAS